MLSRKENLKIPVFGVTALLLFGYASSTYRQCDIWQDSYALWTHTLKYYDRTALPYRNRGHYIREQGNPEAALKDYDIAVSLTPNDADLRNIYNAATQLNYQRWLIWIMDEYKGVI